MASPAGIQLCDDFLKKLEEQIGKEFMPGADLSQDGSPLSVQNFDHPYMLAVWALAREAVIVPGQLNRGEKETLAALVSKSNECKFCANGHAHIASAKGADNTVYKATARNDPSLLSNTKIASIAQWLIDTQDKKSPALEKEPPFSLEEAPEVIGTAQMFNYINRVVDTYITKTELPPAIPWPMRIILTILPFVKGIVFGMRKKKIASTTSGPPGEFAKLLQTEVTIPEDLKWASSSPHIQKAMAFKRMACDELGNKYIPGPVREFVGNYIKEKYDGGKLPLSRNWVFDAADEFNGSEAERSAIVFMLLVSFSRFQIDNKITAELKKHYPEESTRRAMGMWAAFHTARNIADWQAAALQKND